MSRDELVHHDSSGRKKLHFFDRGFFFEDMNGFSMLVAGAC